MSQFFRNNSLSLVMLSCFLVFAIGQSLAGYGVYLDELQDYHRPGISYVAYLTTGHFLEAIFENWESEFLQMGAYVVLTALLIQKGSAESQKPPEEQTEPKMSPKQPASWIYRHSLSLALFGLFALSFGLHAIGGVRAYNHEQGLLGNPTISVGEYLVHSQFWFESFQNWQSEFLSVGALILLSIWLREADSPESKPIDAPDEQTGD